ncbi:Uncharacterised protein [Mycobacterium tuberculosis]|nr:Uncharacterised protein [Mycobacterium tuberculosis]
MVANAPARKFSNVDDMPCGPALSANGAEPSAARSDRWI